MGGRGVRSVLSKIRIGIFLLSPSTHLCANIHLTSHVPVNRDAQRELTTGLDVGAAYVKNIWLGFLLGLAVAIHHYIHHYLSRVVLLF